MAIAAMILLCLKITGKDIWYDEVFSVEFASSSLKDIIRLTSNDVHPPLYYIYLKIVTGIGNAIFGTESFIFFAKLASILPWFGLLYMAAFPVKRHFGECTGGLFILLATIMPKLCDNYVEIRMYSFALMLITAVFVCALNIALSEKKGSSLVGLVIFGTATAYTQYYALVATVGVYLVLGIYLLIKKDGKHIRSILLCALISAAAFALWVKPLFSQIKNVSDEYWILPLTLRSIPGCLKFLFLPSDGIGAKGYITAVIVILFVALIYMYFILKKPDKEEVFISFAGPGVLVFTVLTGFVLSMMGRPIFVYRYMIPAIGAFYISVAFVFSKVINTNKWFSIGALSFLVCGYFTLSAFSYAEDLKIEKMNEAERVLDSIPDDCIVITNFDQMCTLMSYYLPGSAVYLYDDRPDSIVELMYNRNDFECHDEDLDKMFAEGQSNVYFFGSFNSREDILKDWEEKGIKNEETYDSVMIERYYFNIYRLFK
ncbi:MAG: glycosyltransferase family 39 protein [Lachnospiraceae bacterium]|nr:glycosyltransferase family 39 protein [Lachnospiraceae bacterium]